MKQKFFTSTTLVLAFLLLLNSSFINAVKAPGGEYYQLTIYHCKTADQLGVINAYLKNTYLPALHKTGLTNIGVFSSIDNDTATDKRLYVLIPFASLQKYEALMTRLTEGSLIKNNTSDYNIAAFNKMPFERIETTLLKAFKDMLHLKKPVLTAPLTERVYELRSYEAPTERLYRQKVKMFNDGGEVTLFDRLKFNAIFYAEVLSGSHMPNLMYMTTFNNKAERDEHWKNFVDDSVWKKISVMPEYLNTVSKADIFFLHPTEYSDY
ncbi:NIPSNAP family protein [Ferruginibacter sp.]|uniref:NIPSNAP family protein n=1 Tax=Ferruginibacter sp. TaxID=1940288 RepID=UPI00265A92F7|nr:NIPSNAP family protein [Ferruginibacter sp.]